MPNGSRPHAPRERRVHSPVSQARGSRHQAGERIQGARERQDAEDGQRGDVVVVVGGRAVIRQRRQGDRPGTGRHPGHPAQHLIPVATLEQVADQDDDHARSVRDNWR